MGTFSPETCLELIPTLTRQQVEREYVYFGGTVELAIKDKRYKLREYLVNLRDAQKIAPAEYAVPTSGGFPVPTSDQTPYLAASVQPVDTTHMYQAALSTQEPYTSSESFITGAGGDKQLDSLNNLCHKINANVLQLKLDFAEYAVGRGAGGCYDAVDMDLSDPGEDMELSDCDMTQEGASDHNGSRSQM